MIRLAVVEDDESYRNCLGRYLEQYMKENGISFDIHIFLDGEDIVENYKAQFDIIFMDIQMQFMDGMSAAEEIRKTDENVIIIFITNMVQYAIRGYEVKAFDYVLKPITYFTFAQKLDKALECIKNKVSYYLSIPVGSGVQKLDIGQLYYIESQGHMLLYHTKNTFYSSRGNMKQVEEILQPYGFFRSNKGYLVNMKYVDAVKDGCCVINGVNLMIARARKKTFMEALANYMSEVIN